MDDIYSKEIFELDKQLENLEIRHQKLRSVKGAVDLRTISKPEDIGAIAEARRLAAMQRNAKLLQDLELVSGKLHTVTLCPLQPKLEELKKKFLDGCNTQNRKSGTDKDNNITDTSSFKVQEIQEDEVEEFLV